MSKLNRTWMAVVAAALLAGTLAGVVWARPNDRPLAQEATRKVALAAADFIPAEDNYDYENYGGYVTCTTGTCGFTAPVVFPTLGSVTVERIRLHVIDNDATQVAYASLYRENLSTGSVSLYAAVNSPAEESGGYQTYNSPSVNKVVWPSQRAFISLTVAGNINVYGVTVEYHRNM